MKRLSRALILWLLLGMAYYTIEGIWRIKDGGWANIYMLFVGGLCGLIVGYINQIPKFYNSKIWIQCLIGTCTTTLIEFLAGLEFNIVLGMDIWDYSNLPLNIMGQVCLPFSLIWFILMPTAIWLEDTLRYYLFKQGEPYTLISIYKDLFTGK